MTEDEALAAREAGREGAKEVLKMLGFDPENPRETQEDMIFLRDWRKGTSAMKGRLFGAIFAVAIPAALLAVWVGFKEILKGQ